MNNPKLQAINALAPVAKRLRERQEQINAKLRKWQEITCAAISDAADQGRDIVDAKTKLNGGLRWSEWLHAHVPTLSDAQAVKYERLAVEQLTDLRQCVFALLPPSEHEAQPERDKAPTWEVAWGYITKLKRLIDKPDEWTEQRLHLARAQLAPLVKKLWPEGFS